MKRANKYLKFKYNTLINKSKLVIYISNICRSYIANNCLDISGGFSIRAYILNSILLSS